MELCTFDWKHLMMELILTNQMGGFVRMLTSHCSHHQTNKTTTMTPLVHSEYDSDSEDGQQQQPLFESPLQGDVHRDVLDLVSYRLIHHDYSLTREAGMYKPVLLRLLRTPFHTKQYGPITHFHHMVNTESVPVVIQMLTSMTLALIDTVHRYGQYKLFYIRTPSQHRISPNHVFRVWVRVLHHMSGHTNDHHHLWFHDYDFLSVVIELFLTVVMSHNVYESMRRLRVNTRIFRQFLYRWKVLCSREVFHIFQYNGGVTDRTFLQLVRSTLQPYIVHQPWQIELRDYPSFIFPAKMFRTQRSSSQSQSQSSQHAMTGQWCTIPLNILNRFHDRMWRLMDYSSWTQNIRPSDRRLYFDEQIERPYVNIDVDHNLYLPIPAAVDTFVSTLRQCILNAHHDYKFRIQQRQLYQLQFGECVKSIQEEVAYRPGMFRYMECEERYYHYASAISS